MNNADSLYVSICDKEKDFTIVNSEHPDGFVLSSVNVYAFEIIYIF